MWVIVGFGSSMTCVLFQLRISLFIVKQWAITGVTRLVNWLDSSTVCYRRLSKDLHCLLWSSGMFMYCQITPNFLLLLMENFWPGHGCWQLSTRLGARIWSESSSEMPVGFWRNSRPLYCRLWLPVQRLDRDWVVSVQQSSLGETIIHQCICWVFCSMVFWIVDGSRAVRPEACRSEYQSFVQEQRQLERSSTRSRPDIGNVLSFCSSQAGFRAQQHLFKVCSLTNMAKLRDWLVGKPWSCFSRCSS